jgi:hypothetical protein
MAALKGEGFANRDLGAPTPLALLHRIARERLPLVLTHDRDFEAVSRLVNAGHLKATMQVVLPPLGGGPQPGVVVREITRLGLMTLAAPVLDRVGHLIEEALLLAPEERFAVVLSLLDSLHSLDCNVETAVNTAWADEIRRRKEELCFGMAKAASWAQAKARLSAL